MVYCSCSPVKVIPPKQNLHSDFGKSLYTCNSIYVNSRNEIKRGGGPHTTFRDKGAKVHPSGLYILLRKSMRRNCNWGHHACLEDIVRNISKMDDFCSYSEGSLGRVLQKLA